MANEIRGFFNHEPGYKVTDMQRLGCLLGLHDKSVSASVEREPSESAAADGYELIGWLHKVIVDKRISGGAREGQIQVSGVWGRPSEHLYFTPEPPVDRYFWWKAPVYVKPTALSNAATKPEAGGK